MEDRRPGTANEGHTRPAPLTRREAHTDRTWEDSDGRSGQGEWHHTIRVHGAGKRGGPTPVVTVAYERWRSAERVRVAVVVGVAVGVASGVVTGVAEDAASAVAAATVSAAPQGRIMSEMVTNS